MSVTMAKAWASASEATLFNGATQSRCWEEAQEGREMPNARGVSIPGASLASIVDSEHDFALHGISQKEKNGKTWRP